MFVPQKTSRFVREKLPTQLIRQTHPHPPRPANCTLFCLEVLFLFKSLSTDPRILLCKRRIEDFHRAQIVKFVSFTGACTGKYVVKSVKKRPAKLSTEPQKRPVNMQHSLIDPAKLHVFGGSRRHQKMRKNVIWDCVNLWGTSMSFLPVTCDAAAIRTAWRMNPPPSVLVKN